MKTRHLAWFILEKKKHIMKQLRNPLFHACTATPMSETKHAFVQYPRM